MSRLSFFHLVFMHFNGYRLEAAGDLELLQQIIKNKQDKAVVISNHQSLSDVPILMNFWLGINPKGKSAAWTGDNGYRGVTWVMDYSELAKNPVVSCFPT